MGLYLDYNASAPMIKISIAAMIESMNVIGNPSSIHTSGRNAKAIIEVGLESLNPDPSFGSHFFQNVTSLHIAYFTIIKKYHKKYIDWDWLKGQKVIEKTNFIKVIKLKKPLYINLDGIKGEGIILKYKPADNYVMNEEESSGI